MNSPTDFEQRLRRLRQGDTQAIDELISQYEPYIRRTLRFRIARASLQPVVDSIDLCQSVLGSFLLRLSAGEYELHCEDDMRRLLTAITNKKFLTLQRRERATKRDRWHTESLSDRPEVACKNSPEAYSQYAHKELLGLVIQRLTPHERELFQRRSDGESWAAIGDQLNEESSLLRKRLSRAIHRVSVELGLEDEQA